MTRGVMDNFDYEENTLSEIEGNHDTILMLFINENNTLENATAQISQLPIRQRQLNYLLQRQLGELCQVGQLVK